MSNSSQASLCFLKVGFSESEPIGEVVIKLRPDVVPKTVLNFTNLCTNATGMCYKGCLFNRIIPGFMVQGGKILGPHESSFGGRFEDENFELLHEGPGAVSMANRGKDTNGTSFFITTGETPWLDGKHVVFGHVEQGMDVVKKIESYGSASGTPSQEIFILDCGIKSS